MSDKLDFLTQAEALGVTVERNLPMCGYTTFKIGGPADIALFPKNREELIFSVRTACKCGIPVYVVGKGSNLLVADEGFRGAVIFTTEMNSFRFVGNTVYADSGVNLASLSKEATKRGLSGLEFACGIPGTVGGAIYMNAGAYGSEMKDITLWSEYWSPSDGIGQLAGEEQGFGHRVSAFMDSDRIVLGCKMELTEGNADEIKEKCRDLLMQRKEKQPLEYPSAGSAFKRYPGRYTAQMIDEAGLKGFGIGGAQVSSKHAGFIINRGGATARDVMELVRYVKLMIYKREGIEIESEIRYLSPKGEVRL